MSRDRPSGGRWWIAGALVVVVTPPLAAYLWLFELDAIGAVVQSERAGAYTISLHERRTTSWIPWLATHEVVVRREDDLLWHTRIRRMSTPSYLVRGDELLVEDWTTWRGFQLTTGALRWASEVSVEDAWSLDGVTLVLTDTREIRALDQVTGRTRWTRATVYWGPDDELVRAFGEHEAIIGTELVDLRHGTSIAGVQWPFVVSADEVVWAHGDAVMRRRAGAASRRVLEVPSLRSVDALSVGGLLVLSLQRDAAWAPDVSPRSRPERVSLHELTARDTMVIAGVDDADSLQWVVASFGGVERWCALEDDTVIGVELGRIRDGRFLSSAFAIHRETGTVLSIEGTRACPGEPLPSSPPHVP